jgi:hypothetical protein
VRIVSNRRKIKRPRGRRSQRSQHGSLRLVAGQGTAESPRSGTLHAVRPDTADVDARTIRPDPPAMPEAAAREIHVLSVSLHGAVP